MQEIFRLRRFGWSIKELSDKFAISEETIKEWCKVGSVYPNEVHSIPEKALPKPHNYSYYLKQAGLIHRKQGDVLDL